MPIEGEAMKNDKQVTDDAAFRTARNIVQDALKNTLGANHIKSALVFPSRKDMRFTVEIVSDYQGCRMCGYNDCECAIIAEHMAYEEQLNEPCILETAIGKENNACLRQSTKRKRK